MADEHVRAAKVADDDHEKLRDVAAAVEDHAEWLEDLGLEAIGRDRRRIFPLVIEAAWDRRQADKRARRSLAIFATAAAGIGSLAGVPIAEWIRHVLGW